MSDSLPRLIATWPSLVERRNRLLWVETLGHGGLFERQLLGRPVERLELGPPGRPEFRDVQAVPQEVLNLSSQGYLGLSCDPRVMAAAVKAIETFGTHAGGPRLLSGTTRLHYELDQRLAEVFDAEGVATYPSGYAANLSAISALFGSQDVVILDRQAHRSLYDGATMAGAVRRRFAHNDPDHLDHVLRRTAGARRRLVVIDGVYSMGGDIAPVPALLGVVRRHSAFLLVDEAHAFGVIGQTGRGIIEHFGLPSDAIDLRVGSLSKAIPATGGFVAARREVVRLLRTLSRGTLFSAAMTPPDVAAALAGVDILVAEPERVARLQENAAAFRDQLTRHGVDVMGSQTAVIPARMGDEEAALAAATELLSRGIYTSAIVSPGVPAGTERLRCCVTTLHAPDDLTSAASVIGEVVGRISSTSRVNVGGVRGQVAGSE